MQVNILHPKLDRVLTLNPGESTSSTPSNFATGAVVSYRCSSRATGPTGTPWSKLSACTVPNRPPA